VNTPKRVAFLLKAIPHYRKPFYERLREELTSLNVVLDVIYGQVGSEAAQKRDTVDLSWGIRIHNRVLRLGSREFFWQPTLNLLRGADLVVIMQEAKLLLNYLLVLQNMLGIRRVAFWGHGRSFQEHSASRFGEWLKRMLSRRVHWWFAYTERSKDIIRSTGFPADRITVVNNSIDLHSLIQRSQALTPETCTLLAERIGLESSNVGVFIGGMYPEKRLEFLIAACHRIRAAVPDFEMIFVGAGSQEHFVQQAAAQFPWIHYVGPVFDDERVPYIKCAKVMLNPGLVGLSVLDALALEVPMVTTAIPFHSPEIDYLQDGVNGLIVEDPGDIQAFANVVGELLHNPPALARLCEGCRDSRSQYSIENMAENFTTGLLAALDAA